MVAGEPSPDWKKAHAHPPELSETLARVNLGSSADFIRYGVEDLLRHLKYDCQARTKMTLDLLDADEYDISMVVHNVTDAGIHSLWKYMDESTPNCQSSYSKYAHIIRDVYVEVDNSVGKIVDRAGTDSTILFMSDHGACSKPICSFTWQHG